MSCPMYETLHTGLPLFEHGVVSNYVFATLVTEWLERGYDILVTGDHGINADHLHGGTTPEQRDVPLYIIRPGNPGRGNTGEVLSQLQIAPTVCNLLGVNVPPGMKAPPINFGSILEP